jgi:HAD superfamily hydrolase (TIGR01509 family)
MSTAAGTLVIFDCDGVLVDSERLVIDIDVAAVTAAGWPMTREQAIETFVGRSNADVVAMSEAQVGHPLPSDWDAAWEADYRRVFDELLEPVPGVRAAVEQVMGQGRRTCVASSGSHAKMRRTLGRTGLWDLFEGRIHSATEVVHGKPAPDLFLHAAEAMGVHPSGCAVVEDSTYGVRAGVAAGMTVYGFAGGLTPADALLAEGAITFDRMADLVEVLAPARHGLP